MTARADILIVDDDTNTLASLARAFRLAGHEAAVCDNANRALELACAKRFDLIFSDVVMAGKDGIALLEDLRAAGVATPVIMISGQATIEMAVRATRLGAVDFLEKPLATERLLLTVDQVLRFSRLEAENRDLRQRVGRQEIVLASAAMARVIEQVERVAAANTRVCILGETGTGKELVARALHAKSPRCDAPFITLNCASVPAELIESELFGHEKGAFTGATTRHTGKFEQAHHGTLFLDEIGDMPLPMQAKLLRVLEEGEIERVGSERPVGVDVRVVVATHRDLEELVRTGGFRTDLFHRIFVFPLRLPPLRDRPEDIPVLAAHFANLLAEQSGWKAREFSEEAITEMAHYSWPGNVRELRNLVERILLLSSQDPIGAESVRAALPASAASAPVSNGAFAERVELFERETILKELQHYRNHMTRTAKALGLERSHLYKKCQQLGIDLRALRQSD